MAVAKIIEISARSNESFTDAIQKGIEQASKSVDDIKSAWIKEQKVWVEDNKVSEYQVDMKVTFLVHG